MASLKAKIVIPSWPRMVETCLPQMQFCRQSCVAAGLSILGTLLFAKLERYSFLTKGTNLKLVSGNPRLYLIITITTNMLNDIQGLFIKDINL